MYDVGDIVELTLKYPHLKRGGVRCIVHKKFMGDDGLLLEVRVPYKHFIYPAKHRYKGNILVVSIKDIKGVF